MIYIAYPDIPARAVTRTPNFTLLDDYKDGNLVYGERYLRAWQGDPGDLGLPAAKIFTYDLGRSAPATNITAPASYWILARADLLKGLAITTTELESASVSDFSTHTNVHTVDISGATLYGPNSNDYITTFTASSAARYWRTSFTNTSWVTFMLSKSYFGTPFSFGVAPDSFSWTRKPRWESTLETSSGAVEMARLDELVYTFEFAWKNCSDDTVKDFKEKIVRFSNKWRYFLYTTDTAVHFLLNNVRVLHCRLKTFSTENQCKDRNIIKATFEEVIG